MSFAHWFVSVFHGFPPVSLVGVVSQGKMCGVLEDLVSLLGECSPCIVTYAGGASSLQDLDLVRHRVVFFTDVVCAYFFRRGFQSWRRSLRRRMGIAFLLSRHVHDAADGGGTWTVTT